MGSALSRALKANNAMAELGSSAAQARTHTRGRAAVVAALGIGTAIQRCPLCGETFTGTEAGNMHRVLVETYDVVRLRDLRTLSVANERRRCLSVEEMAAKGMARNRLGHWQRGNAGRRTERKPRAVAASMAGSDLSAVPAPTYTRGRAAVAARSESQHAISAGGVE